MNDGKVREDLTYLIDYLRTVSDGVADIRKETDKFMDAVFNEDSVEDMLIILTRLDMEYRIIQSISSQARTKVNGMIRDMKGEL